MMIKGSTIVKALLTAIVISVSLWLWGKGMLQSPVVDKNLLDEKQYTKQYIQEKSPDYSTIKGLAEAYWNRYPDVESDSYYGRKGPMGIFGPKEHFEQHGKREGRIYNLPTMNQNKPMPSP